MQATTPPSGNVVDVPGGGPAKWPTTFGAAAVIFVFYAMMVAGVILLAVWMVLEWVAGFLGGRFRWAFQARQSFREHWALAGVLMRSWRLSKAGETCVPLSPEESPELFAMLESLCLLRSIPFPPQVFVEMGADAWVRLRGYRRGAGKVALGLGFDLLAGTTRSELEAVIAHELSHATLTPRAVRNWLAHGLERAVQLSRGLSKLGAPHRANARSSRLLRVFLSTADFLAEAAAQRIAAYSRQEELAADRGAAEIAGAETLRGALLKVAALGRFAVRLPWRERLAQLQAQTFTPWLVKELIQVKPLALAELEAQAPDRFSTHPSLRDRLKALPARQASLAEADTRPSINLLAEPESVAERLIARVLQCSFEQEERDSRKLRRWGREMRGATRWSALQKTGAALVAAAEIAGAAAWSSLYSAPRCWEYFSTGWGNFGKSLHSLCPTSVSSRKHGIQIAWWRMRRWRNWKRLCARGWPGKASAGRNCFSPQKVLPPCWKTIM
jgi:Zn-dependent protease with chaperone function